MPTPVIFLSDLHIMEGNDQELDRMLAVAQAAIDISGKPGGDCYVAVGGDCIEGTDIHPQQNAMVHISAREQTDNALRLFKRFTRRLEDHFGFVQYRWVGGNHGRTSRTAHPTNNWDIEIGTRLADWAEERSGGVAVVVKAHSWHDIFDVKDARFYMIHKVRSMPTHLETNARKGVVYERLLRHKCDVFLLGHFHRGTHHSHQDGTLRLVVNGALSSCEPFYAEEGGYWSRPSQCVIAVPDAGPPMDEDVHWVRWAL